ncbi:hypothetical protein JVU11DRAFT_1734 [Chiua virens]|nr:hypothetical protein JVU11DRAFT_1734 [Chiua virens]
MDNLVDREVHMNNVNRDRDPLLIFPYVSLPPMLRIAGQTPLETLRGIVESCRQRGMYVDGKWRTQAPSDTAPEKWIPGFFNKILEAACAWKRKKAPGWHDNFKTVWRTHGDTLIEGVRKPDVILVPRSHFSSPVTFRQVYSYCELKRSFNQDLQSHALWQLTEIAGYACAAQINRRFFVASSLCERMFTLAFFVRGCIVFSKAFNIDAAPLVFVTIILGLSSADALWNGFDSNMHLAQDGRLVIYDMSSKLERVLLQELLLYSAKALHGRGTKVPHCTAGFGFGIRELNCILKVSWLPMDNEGQSVTTDIEIYLLMEERTPLLEVLTGRERELFGEQDLYGVFRNCIKPGKHEASENTWDCVKHLPGIPIILPAECSRPCVINPRPNDNLHNEGYYCADYDGLKDLRPDTTNNIIQRFDVPMRDGKGQTSRGQLFIEHRECIWALSRTCGTSLVWFSCRRELVNAMMGALAGHFNGLRMDLLHCDVSDGNVWIEVEGPEANYVVPDWPKEEYAHPKRAGMLGDWGYAADLREKGSEPGRIAGTFPFMAAELLSDKPDLQHTIQHDLESFFWLLWITCVNLNGPFYTRRVWKDEMEDIKKQVYPNSGNSGSALRRSLSKPPSPVADTMCMPPPATTPDSQCERQDLATEQGLANSIVGQPVEYNRTIPDTSVRLPHGEPIDYAPPIWATPGIHYQGPNDVYLWKSDIRGDCFINSVSPYFRNCQKFMDGLDELRQYFGNKKQRHGEITHIIFFDILKKMYDGIDPKQDRTSDNDIKAARKRFENLKVLGGEQGISISVLDEVYIKPATSTCKRPAEKQSGDSVKRARTSPAVSKNEK